MTRNTKWATRIAGIAVVAAAVAWFLWPQPVAVTTARVERGALESTVTAEGKTRVKDLFVVAAPVDGELERIAKKAGDVIARGDVVARLWPAASRPLDSRTRAEAVAAVAAARAAVDRAEASEKEAGAALTHAESAATTSNRLAREGVVASKDAEHAGHEVDVRREAVTVSQAALREARASLVRAEAAASMSVPTASGGVVTDVRSPTAGRVLRVVRESAGAVAAGTPLLEIGNVGAIEIAADFLTSDAIAIQPGAKASILDWGGTEPLAARVRHVDPGGFTKVSALGLEEQRVTVVLDLVGERRVAFGNDFHVNVAVVAWSGQNVLTVPSTSLFRVGNDWAVFIIREERAHLQRVTVGRSDDARTVIERGLSAGDEIAVQPSDLLRDGVRVMRVAETGG